MSRHPAQRLSCQPLAVRDWSGARVMALLLALVLLAPCARAEQPVLVLEDSARSIPVWSALTMLPDPEHRFNAHEVLNDPAAFGPLPNTVGTLGVRTEAVWLRVPLALAPASDEQWALSIDYAPLNRIDVFLARNGRIVQQEALGNLVAPDLRPLPSRAPAMVLHLESGARHELLLRVQAQGAMILPITLAKPAALLGWALQEQMLQGVLTGLALCLLVYSLAHWASLRDALFIQYALLIAIFWHRGAVPLEPQSVAGAACQRPVGPDGYLRLVPVHWPGSGSGQSAPSPDACHARGRYGHRGAGRGVCAGRV